MVVQFISLMTAFEPSGFSLNDEKNSSDRLDKATAEKVFQAHAVEIERFLLGLLRDPALAADIVQTTFVRLIEKGGGVASSGRRSWLFKVSYNEAMQAIRRSNVDRRAKQKLARSLWDPDNCRSLDESIGRIIRAEDIEHVRRALDELNPEMQAVVRLRIYEGLKFAEIAEQLEVPLGTVLTRMRNSLAKLRVKLDESR